MKCPNCEEILVMTARHDIEIDYCPKCRGVWLDKGELDKIIERSESPDIKSSNDNWSKQNLYVDDDFDNKRHPQQKKRGGFLSNLLDFD